MNDDKTTTDAPADRWYHSDWFYYAWTLLMVMGFVGLIILSAWLMERPVRGFYCCGPSCPCMKAVNTAQ